MRYPHFFIVGMMASKSSRYLLGRPIVGNFGSNYVPQLPVNTKQALLGPFASFPGGIISINGSVFRRTHIIINFPTDR
jgi:hypothetical protein